MDVYDIGKKILHMLSVCTHDVLTYMYLHR